MKKIINSLKEHWKADFHPLVYVLVALFLTVTIAINYYYDFEDKVIDAYYGQEIRLLWYFLFYCVAYFGTVLICSLNPSYRPILKIGRFWLFSLTGLLILSLDGSFYHYTLLIDNYFPPELQRYAFKCLSNLSSLLTILLPLSFFYLVADKQPAHFYGITKLKTDLRPYAWMLLIMAPLIIWASFQEDFLESYPSYKDSDADEYLAIPQWLTVLFFELAYGWDYIATEWLFRGFFVIGMAAIIGRAAVLPMTVTYAFLHFGKPLGETIGSIFGGYILGVIAFQSRSIWGGVAIHLGVAWLMEIVAFIQVIRKLEN